MEKIKFLDRQKNIHYLSVCSGIEAATVAWNGIGWNPVGFSEIEPFPSAVLSHHYQDVANFGDMTKFKEWNLDPNGVDLFVGGTPCQSFSVAGLRKGMDDPRGNLALTYCAMLDHFRPRWFVWENVPGVLSSNGGRDFGAFLGAVAELGYGFSYRVLDAQYFGVAQRRRRVFVVGHLGNWQRPAAVLFERESLRRDTAPRREAGQEAAVFTPGSIGGYREGFGTLRANGGDNGGGSENLVAKCLTRGACQRLDFETEDFVTQPIAFGVGETPDTGHCLRSGASRADKHESTTYIAQQMAVRRLTPVECERLQGFPDNYTNIPWRKSDASPDGPRYKALGNSMAVPVMAWIGRRIAEVDAIPMHQNDTFLIKEVSL